MTSRMLPTRRRAIRLCVFAALTAFMCAALLTAAALAPAPPAVLPVLVVICIGCPMVAACELPAAIAGLRAGRSRAAHRARRASRVDVRALAALRRELDQLPETPHPLGD
jgi:hypothetical protein